MNTQKFLNRLENARTKGAAKKALRQDSVKQAKAEAKEFEDKLQNHIEQALLSGIESGEATFDLYLPTHAKSDEMVTQLCTDAEVTFVKHSSAVAWGVDLADLGVYETVDIFRITNQV
jgi:hypothetical protein